MGSAWAISALKFKKFRYVPEMLEFERYLPIDHLGQEIP
jgi:hypothetical protein